MSTPVNIKDSDSGIVAKVTEFGQLVTAPLQYSAPVTNSLDTINTAFNFITPDAGRSIVITDIIASADKSVSNTDPASIEIYEASSATTTTVDTLIVSPQLLRSSNLALNGLNMIVPEGKWVNAKTDDDVILITIMFYRVPAGDV